jgi:hypothetical protein
MAPRLVARLGGDEIPIVLCPRDQAMTLMLDPPPNTLPMP